MRKSVLQDLAQLLLKNHFELREVAASLLSPSSPFKLALNLGGNGHTSTMSVSVLDGQLRVVFRESDRGYEVHVPLKPQKSAALLRVVLVEAGKEQAYDVKPEDFVSAQLPESFKGLHEKVVQYLKSLLPAEFFTKREASGSPAAAPAPEAVSEQPIGTSEAPNASPASAGSASEPADPFSTYIVRRTGEPDLRFRGKLIAAAETWPRNGRQHQYKVFETPAGKFVGVKLGISMWLGELDRSQVVVTSTREDLKPFFGYNGLAKAVYEQMGLKHEEVVE